jgi:ribonuclease HI
MPSHIPPDTLCPLGCDHIDSIEHLYGNCTRTWSNVNTLRKNFSLPPIPRPKRNIASLLGTDRLLSRKEATLNIFLLYTIWEARRHLLKGTPLLLPLFFSTTITSLIGKYCPLILKMSTLHNSSNSLSLINPTTGRSGKRTKEQTKQARVEEKRLVSSFPPSSIIVYTDGGTHNSNPGPCGSGIYIPHATQPTNLSIPLGWGTNNLGELAAIGAAIDHILHSSPPSGTEIHILTDSHLSYGILQLYWRTSLYSELARTIRRWIDNTSDTTPITVHWIAGHADIPGNDAADDNATTAAAHSNTTPPDINAIVSLWRRRLSIPDD